MWISICVVFNFCFALSACDSTNVVKFNTQCKEHACQHGYRYETFYQVNQDERKSTTDPSIAFEMHFAILGANNGHILLSPVPRPGNNDAVYELVVGGGNNSFTQLRRNLKRNARTSANTPNILSAIEFRAFCIKITEDGVIEFGKEGDPMPLLSYMDPDPLDIKYFSFAAWTGTEVKFLYDCPGPNGSEASTDSHAIEPNLTNSEKLKRTLLMSRMPLPPADSVTVRAAVRVSVVRYDAFDSKLSTGISIILSWTDDSMAWDPSKYNGTTTVRFRQGQIWTPSLFVFNGDSTEAIGTRHAEMVTMVYNGEATLHLRASLSSWCVNYKAGLNKWPRDSYECLIIIGPREAHEKITIKIMNADDEKLKMFADIDPIVTNEWEILSLQGHVVSPATWKTIVSTVNNETDQSDKIAISVDLRRRASTFNIVFYTPLLALISFVLMSFWSEPLTIDRVWFYAATTTVICIGICYIDVLVPCHTIPFILVFYITVLISVLLALSLQVVLMTQKAEEICKKPTIQTVLGCKTFRFIFCLPPMKICRNYESINEGFLIQEDDDSGVVLPSRNGIVEEMQTEVTEYCEKKELAEAFDKIMFVACSIIFSTMLVYHF